MYIFKFIVTPWAAISNWAREIETWCPTLKFITYYGAQSQRKELQYSILKSGEPYNIIVRILEKLRNLILDHNI
jgi:SNF2 family DNA or RNA helicase